MPPKQNAVFAANMEDVLGLYRRPHDGRRLMACMDEEPYRMRESGGGVSVNTFGDGRPPQRGKRKSQSPLADGGLERGVGKICYGNNVAADTLPPAICRRQFDAASPALFTGEAFVNRR